LSGSKFWIHQI